MAGEFGADAEFFHDVAEAVEAGVVVEVGAAGEFFDFGAGDEEGVVGLFGDLPGGGELAGGEGDDGESGPGGGGCGGVEMIGESSSGASHGTGAIC